MGKVVRLTESDLKRIVKRVIKENENEEYLEKIKMLVDGEHFDTALQLAETLGLEEKVIDLIIDKIISLRISGWRETALNALRKSSSTPSNIFNTLIIHFIELDSDLKMILGRIDPNLIREKYNEIYSKIRNELNGYHRRAYEE
jgi:hypothetical protein